MQNVKSLLSYNDGQRPVILVFGHGAHDLVPQICELLPTLTPKSGILWMTADKSSNPKQRFLGGDSGPKFKKRNKMDISAAFSNFVKRQKIQFCVYNQSESLLGRSFPLAVFEDFSHFTPNVFARCVETVQGGGPIVLLLPEVATPSQFALMSMESHKRFTTPSHPNVIPRFNARFLLSLASAHGRCLLLDGSGGVLPAWKSVTPPHFADAKELAALAQKGHKRLTKLKSMMKSHTAEDGEPQLNDELLTETPMARLVRHCKSWDQAVNLCHLLEVLISSCRSTASSASSDLNALPDDSEEPLVATSVLKLCKKKSTIVGSSKERPFVVSLTAARGRGKSALLGLAVAGALLGTEGKGRFRHVVITAPCPENVSTLMYFLLEGLKIGSKLKENKDFVVHKSPEGFIQQVTLLSRTPSSNQGDATEDVGPVSSVHFVSVSELASVSADSNRTRLLLSAVDLLCIDEAAAIPLQWVQQLLATDKSSESNSSLAVPRRVLLASTVNGYEGTGRSLALKLLAELRRSCDVGLHFTALNNVTVASLVKKLSAHSAAVATAQSDAAFDEDLLNNCDTELLTTRERVFHELEMREPIRYNANDFTERWLYHLLCLDASEKLELSTTVQEKKTKQRKCDEHGRRSSLRLPSPQLCHLYRVDRRTLFSGRVESETLLRLIMGLFVSSHYKNSPNDLHLLSDAPAHQIYCLFSPVDSVEVLEHSLQCRDHSTSNEESSNTPTLLCVIQACLEGDISTEVLRQHGSNSAGKPAGDLVPWSLVSQFHQTQLASLKGLRIVRIASHPLYQGMGYGTRALEELVASCSPVSTEHSNTLLQENQINYDFLNTNILPPSRDTLPPLLTRIQPGSAALDYIGVSFGTTPALLGFWTRARFLPVVLNQTPNPVTGELNVVLLRQVRPPSVDGVSPQWVIQCNYEFAQRFCRLLHGPFRHLKPTDALSILKSHAFHHWPQHELRAEEVQARFSTYDLARLQAFVESRCAVAAIRDQFEELALLYFSKQLPSGNSLVFYENDELLLLSMGLQGRSLSETQTLCQVPTLSCQNVVHKLLNYLHKSLGKSVANVVTGNVRSMVL